MAMGQLAGSNTFSIRFFSQERLHLYGVGKAKRHTHENWVSKGISDFLRTQSWEHRDWLMYWVFSVVVQGGWQLWSLWQTFSTQDPKHKLIHFWPSLLPTPYSLKLLHLSFIFTLSCDHSDNCSLTFLLPLVPNKLKMYVMFMVLFIGLCDKI